MSATDAEETQSAYGDGGAGGPGAPTPLSVLEVLKTLFILSHVLAGLVLMLMLFIRGFLASRLEI